MIEKIVIPFNQVIFMAIAIVVASMIGTEVKDELKKTEGQGILKHIKILGVWCFITATFILGLLLLVNGAVYGFNFLFG